MLCKEKKQESLNCVSFLSTALKRIYSPGILPESRLLEDDLKERKGKYLHCVTIYVIPKEEDSLTWMNSCHVSSSKITSEHLKS